MFKEIITGFTDILPLIKASAPSIMSLLAGPYAGLAVNLLMKAFGCDSNDPGAICSLIKDHPQAENILKALNVETDGWLDYLPKFKFPSKAELNLKLEWIN